MLSNLQNNDCYLTCLQTKDMLKSDIFLENPFVNYAVIDLSNGQIVVFTS